MDPMQALRQQAAQRALAAAGIGTNTTQLSRSSSVPKLLDAAAELEAAARDMFNQFDLDGTGEISRNDFDTVRARLARDRKREIGTFVVADRDRSGTISWSEFAAMWNASVQYEATHETVHDEASRLKTSTDAAAATEGVLGQKAFSAAYRLSRSVANHTLINMSNNHIGRGVIDWLDRFDPVHSMKHLVCQECALDDKDIVRLAHALRKHPNIRRIDLRGNPIRGQGILALLQLVKTNRSIVEILIDERGIYGPSSQNCERIRKETAMNRRSMGRMVDRRNTLLPPIKDTLYTAGDVAHPVVKKPSSQRLTPPSQPRRRLSGIMSGLFSAKVNSAKRWQKAVDSGKAQREKAREQALTEAKAHNIVTQGLETLDQKVDIRRQGNLDMYSDTALRQRTSLREHPEIKACCHRWWSCLIIPIIDKDRSGTISREEYLIFHKCLNLALMHEEQDRVISSRPMGSAAATRLALEDWEHDAAGGKRIEAGRFEIAMFELADLWTDTTDPQEYVDFLDWLFAQMVTAMSKFPNLSESQRVSLRFQKRRQRLVADAKRAKTARLASIGVRHLFDSAALARLHRDFERFGTLVKKDANDYGELLCSRLAFNKVMALQGYPSGALTSRLFDVFDVNHSERISFQEFLIGLSLLCSDSLEKMAELVFKLFDVSETGRITRMSIQTVLSVISGLRGNVVALDAVKRNLDEIFAAQSIRDQQEAGYTQEHFVKVLRAHPELVASVIDVKSQKRLRKNLVL